MKNKTQLILAAAYVLIIGTCIVKDFKRPSQEVEENEDEKKGDMEKAVSAAAKSFIKEGEELLDRHVESFDKLLKDWEKDELDNS
jgi:hypothetical protein